MPMQREPDNRPAIRPGFARPPELSTEKLALSPKEAAKVVQQLRELCLTKGEDVNALESAVKALRDSGYKQELSQVLREAVTWPESHPHVGALWIRRVVSSNGWDRTYPKAMDELCRRGEIGQRAVIEFLENVAAQRRPRLVRQTVAKHRKWLQRHPIGWGVTARALANVRLYHVAARWMSDWRARPDLDLALLHSLALGLRGVGREREAHEVVQLALAGPASERQFPILKLWFAQEEALAGNTQNAAAHLKDVRPVGWEEDSVRLFYLVRGVIRVQQAEPGVRREAFAAAYDRIRDHFRRKRVHQCELMLRRQYRRCVWRMARDSGNLRAGLLANWRSADRVFNLIPLLLVPGLQLVAPLYLLRLSTNRQGRKNKGWRRKL